MTKGDVTKSFLRKVFAWYGVHKKESQFDNFHYNTFFMSFSKHLENLVMEMCN
jgi:hypothetical protein